MKAMQSDIFFDIQSLLPELIQNILLSIFYYDESKEEFPKLFCVCKSWVELIDCPFFHFVVEGRKEEWYRNNVQNNLRMFSKNIFPTVIFMNNLVSNAEPLGLLHSGAIIRELGRIETTNGVYCETVNGCCRFINQHGDVYLEPLDLLTLGPLYSSIDSNPVKVYLHGFRRQPPNEVVHMEYHDNIFHSGVLMEGDIKSEILDDNYIRILSSNNDISVRKDDVLRRPIWFFSFPSINKKYCFVNMKSRGRSLENDEEFSNFFKTRRDDVTLRQAGSDATVMFGLDPSSDDEDEI